ncbi:MAG: cation:proton antiporter [Emergencia sp.]
MTNYYFLLTVAIIILSTKFLGGLSEKVNMPQVVGALIAGVILGPSVLGVVGETDFLAKTAEIGVILLMFIAGLDTDINEIKKNSIALLVIASMGVLVPLIGGFTAYYFYFDVDPGNFNELLSAVFMGVVLTATSVSITVEALREMGKLGGPVGSAILGAAVLDDIIGIIILTIVTSMKDPSVSIVSILIRIGLYIILMAVIGVVLFASRATVDEIKDKRRISIYVMALVLIVAFVSEHFFGIADITGAYLVGLFLSTHEVKTDIAKKMTVPSYLFFSPIFFASIGIKTELSGMNRSLLIFSLLILVIAVVSKIIGCGLGAKLCGYSLHDSVNIGIGMISRGEVALIVAQKGYDMGLLSGRLFSPVVLVVIVTTIITPVFLKKYMK